LPQGSATLPMWARFVNSVNAMRYFLHYGFCNILQSVCMLNLSLEMSFNLYLLVSLNFFRVGGLKLLNIPPHFNCKATLSCEIFMFKNCHAHWLSAANCGVRYNHSKKVVEKYMLVWYLLTLLKNNLCSNITKAKFPFVIDKLSGQFFIFKQDHYKANRARKAISPFARNFAKRLI